MKKNVTAASGGTRPHPAAVARHDARDGGEADAAALEFGTMHAREGLEQARRARRVEADTVVAHEMDRRATSCCAFQALVTSENVIAMTSSNGNARAWIQRSTGAQ